MGAICGKGLVKLELKTTSVKLPSSKAARIEIKMRLACLRALSSDDFRFQRQTIARQASTYPA
jgi:hypothetical protein